MVKLRAADIFNDHMILQRGKAVRVWGEAMPGRMVTVRIQGREAQACSDREGKWQAVLPELSASAGETMEIVCGAERIVFTDVLVGEVWLAGGQSNMEFQMFYDKNYEEALAFCENPLIRVYDVPKAAAEEHLQRRDFSLFGVWREANSENLKYYSAAAYYFARALQEDLQVPVGIVGCNWGGSRAACWMDRATLEECGPVWIEDYEKGLLAIEDMEQAKEAYFANPMGDTSRPFDDEERNRWMRGLDPSEMKEIFGNLGSSGLDVIGPWHEWRPCGIYEMMLRPIMPYTLRGVIYYQGESDDAHPEIYANMLEGMIGCWRKGFADELPFLMTQLAPFGEVFDQGGRYYPVIREQQELAAERIAQVWCASIGDVGDLYDIHPKEKRPVGERLALLARGHVYGEKLLCEAPVGVKLCREGQALTVDCANAPGGLVMRGEVVPALQVYRPDGGLVDQAAYQVTLDRERLIIRFFDEMDRGPYKIRFAKTPYYEVNVYNMSRIPMKPFVLAEGDMGAE